MAALGHLVALGAGVQRALGQGRALRPALPLAVDLLQHRALAVLGHRDEAAAAQLLGLGRHVLQVPAAVRHFGEGVVQLVAFAGCVGRRLEALLGHRGAVGGFDGAALGGGRKARGGVVCIHGNLTRVGWQRFKAGPTGAVPGNPDGQRAVQLDLDAAVQAASAVAAVVGHVVADRLVRGADARRVHARGHQVVADGGRTLAGDAALDGCVAAAVGAPA